MIEAMIGTAVFNDNQTLFDHAVKFWNQRIGAYFYNVADGNTHLPFPPGRTGSTWYHQGRLVDLVCISDRCLTRENYVPSQPLYCLVLVVFNASTNGGI